jgi:predicted PurR-regulated permease PerM
MSTAPPHSRRPAGRARLEPIALAVIVMALIGGVGVLLYFARAAFVPVVFSLLIALVLSSPVEWLHRLGTPRTLGAALILLLFVGALGLTLGAIWAPARTWTAAIPAVIERVEQKLGPVAPALEHVVVAAKPEAPPAPSAASRLEAMELSASTALLSQAPAIAANAVTVVMLTLFLLAGGAPMAARVAATLTSESKVKAVLDVVVVMRREVARYYALLALINLGLGIATAAMTALLALPNPLLWGAMAGLLNFIPYAGSAVTLVLLTMAAFVTFDGVAPVIAVAASFLALVTIEGQVVEPLLIGRRLKLSPIVVFLALWFGGWFWGVAGVVLAIPALVVVKVVAEHSRNGTVLVELLSPAARKPYRFARSVAAAPDP